LLVEFKKLQSLVELNLSGCFELGCLPNSIVDLSQLKTSIVRVPQIGKFASGIQETS
jgi:hypothetical protein